MRDSHDVHVFTYGSACVGSTHYPIKRIMHRFNPVNTALFTGHDATRVGVSKCRGPGRVRPGRVIMFQNLTGLLGSCQGVLKKSRAGSGQLTRCDPHPTRPDPTREV